MTKKTAIIVSLITLAAAASLFYFRHQVYYSHGGNDEARMFSVKKGEGNTDVATHLADAGLVENKWYFYYYLRTHGMLNKIMPGDYNISGKMTVPQIASILTNTEKAFVKITFPEGLTAEEMAELLEKNGFDRNGFMEVVKNPKRVSDKFPLLVGSDIETLNGYLFPDTYFFSKDATPEGIVSKMLDNFERRISKDMIAKMNEQRKSLEDIMIMASLIQGEVKTAKEMKLVSGVFWKRLEIGMPLQSDAEYGTYDKKGLPEAPISNPGLEAITAALYPQTSDYLYFVSNKETGETFFGKTFDEHRANKIRAGY